MKTLARFAAAAAALFLFVACEDLPFRNDLARLVANSVPTLSVVYNDGSPADTARAEAIRTLMAIDLTQIGGVSGTMPSVRVDLVAQSSIPTSFDPTYILAGVILLTPECGVYSEANQSRNIAVQGRGVFAMGWGGNRCIDTINANWSAWGLSGQQPEEIGWFMSASGSSTSVRCLGTAIPGPSTGAWTYPLSSTSIPGVDGNPVALYSTSNGTYEQYNPPPQTPPVNGALYGQDAALNDYAVIVRQGRFLQYGFMEVPDVPATGGVLFVNLVSLMMKF